MNSDYLKLVEYLNKLNIENKIIEELIKVYKLKKYKKYECFAAEGQMVDKVGFIIEGLFYMYNIKSDGSLFVKQFITNGQFLLATLNPLKESSVYIKSVCNATILEAKYSEVLSIIKKYPELEKLSQERTETEIDAISDRLRQFGTICAEERYLLFKQNYGDLEQKVPQYLVSAYLGITPTHLSRIKTKQTNHFSL